MLLAQQTLERLAEIPKIHALAGAPLKSYTRFGIGGPADIYLETAQPGSFVSAVEILRASGLPWVAIGGGTNLIVSDRGFRGAVLRFTGGRVECQGTHLDAEAGAELQAVVDSSIACGLQGLETLAGIPGSFGAAVYGNAGAYGHSISELVATVRFFDGAGIRVLDRAGCRFQYRDSVFKRHKDWVIFSAELELQPGDASALRQTAGDIVKVRNEKFPVTMKCAGSVFKNLLFRDLSPELAAKIPERVVREGKVPAAFFLEQSGAKGLERGDIHVAPYHANLIYNGGAGTAEDLTALIRDLKQRVRERFGLELEEEVQYLGFGE